MKSQRKNTYILTQPKRKLLRKEFKEAYFRQTTREIQILNHVNPIRGEQATWAEKINTQMGLKLGKDSITKRPLALSPQTLLNITQKTGGDHNANESTMKLAIMFFYKGEPDANQKAANLLIELGFGNRILIELETENVKRQIIHYADENTIERTRQVLFRHYHHTQYEVASQAAKTALDKHGPHPKILGELFRIEMTKVDKLGYIPDKVTELRNVLSTSKDSLSQELKEVRERLFGLTLFEYEFRKMRYEESLITDKLRRLRAAYHSHLEKLESPKRDPRSNKYNNWAIGYFDWLGRFDLYVGWWTDTAEKIAQAIKNFDLALEITKNLGKEGWWLRAYRCNALRLLSGDKELKAEVQEFKKQMDRLQLDSKHQDKISIKLYTALSHIYCHDIDGLKNFVDQTTIEATLHHGTFRDHIEMYYHKSTVPMLKKKKEIIRIVTAWLAPKSR